MTLFQKYLLILLAILVGSLSFYLLSNSLEFNNSNDKDSSKNNTSSSFEGNQIESPEEYHIRVIHVGGEGITNRQTEIIDPIGGDGWDLYLKEPDFPKNIRSPSFINSAKDLIWISCKDDYTLKTCRSSNGVEINDNNGMCGLVINQMKVEGRIECIKK